MKFARTHSYMHIYAYKYARTLITHTYTLMHTNTPSCTNNDIRIHIYTCTLQCLFQLSFCVIGMGYSVDNLSSGQLKFVQLLSQRRI